MKAGNSVLGVQSSRNASSPAKVKETLFKFQASCIPSTTDTGGCFALKADSGPIYPGLADTVGTDAKGFKLTDFFATSTISQFDYFRIKKIEYSGSVAVMPKDGSPNLQVYCSVDWDNASTGTFSDLMARPNKSLTVLSAAAPTQKLVEYVPRRRISSNADPSLQIVTQTGEWLDCAQAGSFIFGNLRLGLLCPAGQAQYPVSNQGQVLITSILWVEFRGRLHT